MRTILSKNEQQNAASGIVYLMGAQIAFILSGYILQIGLGRLLNPAGYGIYSVVIYIATVINLILTTGFPLATSKYISKDKNLSLSILKTTLSFSLITSISASILMYLCAKIISQLLNDITLIQYIQLIALMIPSYTILSVISGYYNGLKFFRTQSILTISYNLTKMILILLFVIKGFSVWGAIFGFVMAPLIPLSIISRKIINKNLYNAENYPLSELMKFTTHIIIFYISINLITNLDLFFVKGILINNEYVGFYAAASTISKVPYLLMNGITGVLFPLVSASAELPEKIQKYVAESLRYTLMLIMPITFMVVGSSSSLVSLLYSKVYYPAGYPLMILAIGMCLFSVFSLMATVINGCGNPRVATFLSIIILMIDYFLNIIMVPKWGMNGAALSTSTSSGVGLLVGAIYIYKKHHQLMSSKSFVNITISSIMVLFMIISLNFQGFKLILSYIIVSIIYFLSLFLLGEISTLDLYRLKSLLSKVGSK